MNTKRTVAVVTAIVTATLSSCTSSNSEPDVKNTITQHEAIERVEQYIRDAVSALSPEPRLELTGRFDDSPCDDPTDNGPKGRVIASVGYWLNDIPVDRQLNVIDTLAQWWAENNFAILYDTRPKDTYVWVENRSDGFRMAVRQTSVGPKRLSLDATSPCVWPKGTPEPTP